MSPVTDDAEIIHYNTIIRHFLILILILILLLLLLFIFIFIFIR
ncbi:hypothetical protein QUF72_14985 [Desulfobacterales bacterium HSG2]|nr:hypothetical protein [Desulfobacterales bacterium HSG2]